MNSSRPQVPISIPPLSHAVEAERDLLTHPGQPQGRRISGFIARYSHAVIVGVPGETLNALLTREMTVRGWTAASGFFIGGDLDHFEFSFPIENTEGLNRVDLSPPQSVAGATVVKGGITVGSRAGMFLAHTHALFLDSSGRLRAGHLHYPSIVLGQHVRIALWGASDLRVESLLDSEIGVPIFQYSVKRESTSNGIAKKDELSYSEAKARPPRNKAEGLYARLHPNVDITFAIEELATVMGSGPHSLVVGQIGSLSGVTFVEEQGMRPVKPFVVEVIGLDVRFQNARHGVLAYVYATVVDDQGDIHSGLLERGRNPVAMTFELTLIK